MDRSLKWVDVFGVALLGGIGFTVSLLIGELAFAGDGLREDNVTLAVLIGTVIAAALAATVLRIRNRAYARQDRSVRSMTDPEPATAGGSDGAAPGSAL